MSLLVVLFLMLVALIAVAVWRGRPLKRRFANPDVENICRDWEAVLGPRETWDDERREMFRNIADHRTKFGSAAFCLALLSVFLVGPVFAQDPPATIAKPSADTWSASLYTGALSVLTRNEKREYLSARATVTGTVRGPLLAFGRGDLAGTQDGGALEPGAIASFRSIEVAGGLRYEVKPRLSVAALAGVTYSVEGREGAPVDPRLYTLAAMGRLQLGDGGYFYLGGGHHGPVGGPALLVAASIPVKSGSYAVADFALPLRTVADRSTWVLKVGASVRVKSIGLGF